tara:strand:+ start:845 stop:1273 length:429 start_codon:yes stop_codon:yes gene_type:complete
MSNIRELHLSKLKESSKYQIQVFEPRYGAKVPIMKMRTTRREVPRLISRFAVQYRVNGDFIFFDNLCDEDLKYIATNSCVRLKSGNNCLPGKEIRKEKPPRISEEEIKKKKELEIQKLLEDTNKKKPTKRRTTNRRRTKVGK